MGQQPLLSLLRLNQLLMFVALPAPSSRATPVATHFYLLQPQTGSSTVSRKLPKGVEPTPHLLWGEAEVLGVTCFWLRNLLTEGATWPPTPITKGSIVQPRKEGGLRTKRSPSPIQDRPPTLCTKGLLFFCSGAYVKENPTWILSSCQIPAFATAWAMRDLCRLPSL